jgi:hypothetical protein
MLFLTDKTRRKEKVGPSRENKIYTLAGRTFAKIIHKTLAKHRNVFKQIIIMLPQKTVSQFQLLPPGMKSTNVVK